MQATQQRIPSTQFDVDFTGIFASLNEFKVYLWEVFEVIPFKRKPLCPVNKATLVI